MPSAEKDTCGCYTPQEHERLGHAAENAAALVEQVAEGLRTSRLSWGTHSDHWGDVDWQREFWTEAATIALTTARVIPPGSTEADQ